MAELTLVIGANGAGKSTWCRLYAQTLPRYFYDADSIAQGLGSYNDPELQRAARALIDERIQTHLDRRENFGFESTYSGASRPAIVRKAKTLGYRTYAIFIGTRDVGINIERVAKRVASRAGHHVPEEEIKRHPHLENVYSNILAFFLDPGREHGFGSLFFESLLSVAEYKEEKIAIRDGKEVEINREEITGTRKRIDLVISTDTLIVGIENKIYHELHNDLEDYGQHLTKKAKANGNGQRVCKILLGLKKPSDDQELSGFKPVTYESYFGEILRRIGPILIGSKDRYLRFALEMIETAKHLTEGSAMDPTMLDFFKDNEEDVLSLSQEINNLKEDLRTQVKALGEILDISDSQNRRINPCFLTTPI